tara:strand:- start:4464 stop:4850 length:387 start_codon:yes stop_codon:yes gene_type:complete
MKNVVRFLYINFILFIVNNFYCAQEQYGSHKGLGSVSFQASMVLNNVAKLILYIAIIAGIAFILTSLLKLKQHWRNPQQVSISQVISLFILGLILVGIPMLIHYNQNKTTIGAVYMYDDYQKIRLARN